MEPLIKESQNPQNFSLWQYVLGLLDTWFNRAQESRPEAMQTSATGPNKPEDLSEMSPQVYLQHAPEALRPWLQATLGKANQPKWAPWEMSAYSRLGLNPEDLAFASRASNFIRGLKAQQNWMTNLLQGKPMDVGEDLGGEEAVAAAAQNKPEPPMLPGGAPSTNVVSYT